MNQKTRFSLWYVMLALVGVFMLHDAWTETRSIEPIPYSEFQRLLKEGKIKEIVISGEQIQGDLKEPLNGRNRFVTTRVDHTFAQKLAEHDVKFAQRVENRFLPTLLSWVVPALASGFDPQAMSAFTG
jgi:cell division protease FtsH